MRNRNDLNRRTFLKSACLSLGAAPVLSGAQKANSGASLVQRLGYAADARVLIITADEFGECHASNTGIIRCWEAGLLKSVTFQAPGAWAPDAAEYARKHPEMDVGVHLTLATGSVAGIGVRPILPRAEAPGLYTPDGYLWPNGTEAWKHTTVDEIKRESRAQIEKAIHMGIDPTHLDPHDGIMQDLGGAHMADFMKLYGELAKEFNLPIKMPPTQAKLVGFGQPGMRAMISKLGVLMTDEGMASHGQKSFLRQVFHERAPGTVTELYIHPAVDGPEVEAVRSRRDWWKVGVGDFQLFTTDRDEVRQAIKEEKIILIGWREIPGTSKRRRRIIGIMKAFTTSFWTLPKEKNQDKLGYPNASSIRWWWSIPEMSPMSGSIARWSNSFKNILPKQ